MKVKVIFFLLAVLLGFKGFCIPKTSFVFKEATKPFTACKYNMLYTKSYKNLQLEKYFFNIKKNNPPKTQNNNQSTDIDIFDSKQKNLQFSKLISILSIALISILSLLSLSLYKNNKIRINTNKLLQEKNTELIKEKEKVEKASKARSEFLATVSHELRTPLNAINGITYLLLQENPRIDQIEYIKSLEFSGNYLIEFINDILEINRLESDKVKIEKISFDLIELIKNISNSFKEFLSNNNVNLHLNIDKEINYQLLGDPTKLSQIIINLVNNAIKFSKDGDVWLKINQKHIENGTVILNFEIKDNGIGIPFDKQAEIFESFSQGSVEINRTYGGTGLGLAIVKRLVEILESEIFLESKPHSGSTFSFDLKYKISYEKTKKSKQSFDNITFNNKTILLVEDNKINQMITKRMLENKGINCTILETGEEAIDHLKSNGYDLILMDVHLQGINGTEAVAIIRNFNNKTPIIALTAISLNENREKLLSYGMNDVITKPFVPENFYEVLAQYLA